MSRLLHVSVKDNSDLFQTLKKKAVNFLHEILPTNISLQKEIVVEKDNSISFVLNPTNAIKVRNENILIGLSYSNDKAEWERMKTMPDGNYVIKRENDNLIEFVTDFQATKSLWYYFDKELLIVSSSQRAIVHLLGNFKLNEQAVMWMLSSGTLGYKNSWDIRINSIPAASMITLDKHKWELSFFTDPVIFTSNKLTLEENLNLFDNKLNNIFSNIDLKGINPILSITGGYDSRTVFHYLKIFYPKINLMTFGDKGSLNSKYSDLYVSHEIAKKHNLDWRLFDTHPKLDEINDFFQRFFKLGEGRIDLLERVSDNMQWLIELRGSNYDVLFNGMEGFSSQNPFKFKRLNFHLRKLFLLNHFSNVNLEIDFPQFYHQDLYINDENSNHHYYSINQLFFNPYGDAALNEIQNCYFDVINPLLSKSIISFIRQLPNKQRVSKKIAKKLITQKDDSNIPYADKVSVLQTGTILRKKSIDEFINESLINQSSVFSKADIETVLTLTNQTLTDNIVYDLKDKSGNSLKSKMFKLFPESTHMLLEIKKLIQKCHLDPFLLKYRMYIIEKMNQQFYEDATKKYK